MAKSTKKLIKEYKQNLNKLKRQKVTLVIEEDFLYDDEMHRLYGLALKDLNIVKLEKSMNEKLRLYVLVHELVHLAFPKATEQQVLSAEKIIGECLWKQGYRRVLQ
ncbi:MAG: hypothetical protein EKK57_07340 [Proteobacteria bacterium]|nr:MAG: hypothetical protein EKK57_07340 [Pseudomonadota bacterium]